MQSLDARFKSTTSVINMAAPAQAIASATATKVIGSDVYINPREAGDGLCFRYKCGGSKTGTNAAQTMAVYLGSTALCTCTADASTAVDWECEFTVVFKNHAAQACGGKLLMDTEDPDIQYDTGTVDCTAGLTMTLKATSHASDSLVIGWITVERMEFSPMATA